MIRAVLAEDQSLLCGALATLLTLENDIEIVGQAADGEAAWTLIRETRPDLLVTDIEMPLLSGIELAERVREHGMGCRVMIVTTYARPGYLQRAMQAGVTGYVLKDSSSEELAAAVRKVHAGEVVVAADLAGAAWSAPDPLTERERQILQLAESGKQNKQIANELHLSLGTVRNYLASAAQKLGAANRIEAFRIARENGWL